MREKMRNKLKEVAANKNAVKAIKSFALAFTVAVVTLAYSKVAFASTGPDLSGAVNPIVALLKQIVNPLMLLVGAGGSIFCIFLGVKYATAEEPQEREKRKQALKTAIIGYFLIFILIVALRMSIQPLTDWANSTSGAGLPDQGTKTTESTTQSGN